MGYFTHSGLTCPAISSSTLPSLKASKLLVLGIACIQNKTGVESYKGTATLNGNNVTETSWRYGSTTYPQGTTVFEFENITEDDVIIINQPCWGSCEIYYLYV